MRGERKLLQRREFGGFFQATLDVVLLLELAELRGDDADNDDLVALGQEAQRLEATGAVGPILLSAILVFFAVLLWSSMSVLSRRGGAMPAAQ